MTQTIAFWLVLGLVGFAWALAVQMRMVVAKVLRLSVRAQYDDLHEADMKAIVRASVSEAQGQGLPEPLRAVHGWLRGEHPAAIRHLALARRTSQVLPPVLVVILVIGRVGLGVI